MRIWIQLLPQSGSESREPNSCGYMRIRVLVRLCRYIKLNFYMYMKIIHHVGNTYLRRHKSLFERLEFSVSDRTSGVAAEGWKEAPDAGKVPRLGLADRRGDGAGYGDEEKDEERR
jgi:hypothetical protein